MVTFYAGGPPRAQTFEDMVDDWDIYSPSWTTSGTQPVIGNGTLSGRYKQVGHVVHFKAGWEAGTTTTFGTGQWNISLPVAAQQPGSPLNEIYIGQSYYFDASSSGRYIGVCVLTSASAVVGYVVNSAAGAAAGMTVAVPVASATSDRFVLTGTFESS